MMQGRIVKSGGPELAQRLEAEGYDWIKEELGIVDETVGQDAEEFKIPMNTPDQSTKEERRETLILGQRSL